jgi:hypothetical protein
MQGTAVSHPLRILSGSCPPRHRPCRRSLPPYRMHTGCRRHPPDCGPLHSGERHDLVGMTGYSSGCLVNFRCAVPMYMVRGYSRCEDRSSHLCFKTVLASFPAHGSSMTESLSWIRCLHSQRSVNLFLQQRRDHIGFLSSLPPQGAALFMGYPICYWQLYTLSHRLHVSISSGFPRGIRFLKDPSLSSMRLTPAPGHPGERRQGYFVPYHHSRSL